MPKRVYAPYKHPDERIVDALVEEVDKDVDLLVNFWVVNGRPAFLHKLTEDELLLRFANPVVRQQIIADLEARSGSGAVAKYLSQMVRMLRRFVYTGDLG